MLSTWGTNGRPNPAQIMGSALHSWIDFTDASTVTLASGRISQIVSKDSGAKTFVQGTAGQRPYYDTEINGLTVGRFAYADQTVLRDATNAPNSPYDAFFVYKHVGALPDHASHDSFVFENQSWSSLVLFKSGGLDYTQYNYTISRQAAMADVLVVNHVHQTGGAGATMNINQYSATATMNAETPTIWRIGNGVSGGGGFEGLIAELVFSTGLLSAAQITATINYLKAKYAISF